MCGGGLPPREDPVSGGQKGLKAGGASWEEGE